MGVAAVVKGGQWKFLLVSLALWGGTFAIEYLDRGYRVGYDDDAIYMRPHGVTLRLTRQPVTRIPFSDIAAVTAERNQRGNPAMNLFTPFDYARVSPRDWQLDDAEFALVGGELFDDDLRELLHIIENKAPGTINQTIATWLQSSRRF